MAGHRRCETRDRLQQINDWSFRAHIKKSYVPLFCLARKGKVGRFENISEVHFFRTGHPEIVCICLRARALVTGRSALQGIQ